MNALAQKTEWDDESTRVFLKYGQAFVPYRETQYGIICRILSQVRPRRVVELCCGQGKLSGLLLETLPEINLQAFDGSELMLESARKSLARFGGRLQTVLFDIHAKNWREFSPGVDAFVSSLALHHLTAEEKGEFYRDLFSSLSSGGVFINADLIWPPTPEGQEVAAQAWDDSVRRFSEESPDGQEAYQAFKSLRWNLFRYPEDNSTDHPLPVAQELQLLSKAGFVDADVYWLFGGHAIIGCRKK